MKLRFYQEPNYMINKEKGVVICILECGFDQSIFNPLESYGFISTKNIFPYWKVKGIAKLHPDDVFNETIGRRIAESKAKQKAYKKGANILSSMVKNFDRASTELIYTIHFLSEKESFEVEHYNTLVD